jgi:hypothetical protein
MEGKIAMPKLLTRLKISEVSAVDKGAGEDCRILFMKRDQDVVAKASAALQESVGSILNCDENDAIKREALAETFRQFESYLERNGVDIGKADRSGPHSFTAALLDHLHDALDRKRQRHGFEKTATKESTPMNDSIEKIAADNGPYGLAKILIDDGHAHQIDEHRFVRLITDYAKRKHPELTGDRAFERVFVGDGEASRVLQKAHAICKAATAAFDVTIVEPGGETHRTVNDTESSEAYQTLQALADKLHEAATGQGKKLTKEQAFVHAFESNPELARKAHWTPVGGSTFYPMPNFSPEALGRRR